MNHVLTHMIGDMAIKSTLLCILYLFLGSCSLGSFAEHIFDGKNFTAYNLPTTSTEFNPGEDFFCDSAPGYSHKVKCNSSKCKTISYSCGNWTSNDCDSEYHNAIQNGDLASFYKRCASEGGAEPLRTRCKECCPNSSLPDEDGDCRKDIFKGCASDQDQTKCSSQQICGSRNNICVCDETNLCNRKEHCTYHNCINDLPTTTTEPYPDGTFLCESFPNHSYPVKCSSKRCLSISYSCGNETSSDCKSEYDNAIQNGNLDYFYRRCATEGGSQPLRTRCLKCCPNFPPSGEDGECAKEVFKGCATDQDQNKCSQEVCGYQVNKCICEGVSLCNQQGNCTQCSKASVQNPMIIKHMLFVIALVLIVPFSLVEYCI